MVKFHLLLLLTFYPIFLFSQNCIYVKDHNHNELNTNINCGFNFLNSCIKLQSNFPIIKDSDQYLFQGNQFNTTGLFNEGEGIKANDDDKFLKRIYFNEIGNKPFSFNYYGSPQNSVIISSNGFISFDNNYQVNDFSTPNLNGSRIPSSYLPKSSIFGPFQDLSFSTNSDSDIFINIEGEFPCRKLVINFYKGKIVGTNQTSTFQIVLHELTSKIDINVLEKPYPNPSARFKSTLLGITDSTGNGISVPNRNTGIWEINNESYSFIPNGKDLQPQIIEWTNNNNDNSIFGNSLNVCDITPAIYSANAKYITSSNKEFYIVNDHSINIEEDYPIATNFYANICESDYDLSQNNFYSSINSQVNPDNFNYKFYLTEIDALNDRNNYIPQNQILDFESTYYVRIENKSSTSCFQVAKLEIGKPLNIPNKIEICDNNNNDLIEEYNLENLNCKIFENIPDATNIRYYINNSTTPVTTYPIINNTNLKVVFDTETCINYTVKNISLQLSPSPTTFVEEINFESYEKLFDFVTNNNPSDREPIDWKDEIKKLNIQISSNPDTDELKVFKTLHDAQNNLNQIEYIQEGIEENNYRYTWYLKIENQNYDCNGNCYTIIPLNIIAKFNKIILNISDKDPDKPMDNPSKYDNEIADVYLCANQNYTLNLALDVDRIFKVTNHDIKDLIVTYHLNYTSANNLKNNGINSIFNVTNNNTRNFYVRIASTNGNYIVKHLKYSFLPNIPQKNSFEICVDNQLNFKNIFLEDYISELIPEAILNLDPTPIIEFYSDENAQNLIHNYTVDRTYKTIWVKIKYTQTENICETISPIQFKLVSVENILKNYHEETLLCDNNLDGLEIVNLNDYLNNFVDNTNNYTFKFYKNFNPNTNVFSNQIKEPTSFTVNNVAKIFIEISTLNQSAACTQMVELKLIFDPEPIRQIYMNSEAYLLICNEANNQNVTFNLENSIPQFFNDLTVYNDLITSVKYYENYNDAFIGNSNHIQNYNQYQLLATQPSKIIYARFDNTYGCFNIKPINLSILGFIKFKSNLSLDTCDINFDGMYEFNPQQWINSVVNDTDDSNDLMTDYFVNKQAEYKLYYTLNDYINGNSIPLNQLLILNPTIHDSLIISASIQGGCDDYISIKINYNKPTSINIDIDAICDTHNDNIEFVDLTQIEQDYPNATYEYYRNLSDINTNSNSINNPDNFELNLLYGNKIYVKITSEYSCPIFIILNFYYNQSPIIEIPDFEICKDEFITINPNYLNWNIVEFEWTDEEGNLVSSSQYLTTNKIGRYNLKITTTNNCTSITSFTIKEKIVPNLIEIQVHNNNIIIKANGIDDKTILYSLDKSNWQTDNTFENLDYGTFNIYLKYKEIDCIVGPYGTLIPKLFNTISPNDDGINDIWKLNDLNIFEGKTAEIIIYDRFGKIIFSQKSDIELIWDGKINGKPIPSTSYWYTITFPDNRRYTGNIHVINK